MKKIPTLLFFLILIGSTTLFPFPRILSAEPNGWAPYTRTWLTPEEAGPPYDEHDWVACNGLLRQEDVHTAEYLYVGGDEDWADYTFSVRVKTDDDSHGDGPFAGIVFRAQENGPFCCAYLRPHYGNVEIATYSGTNGRPVYSSSDSVQLSSGTWYKLAVEVRGNDVRIFLDDNLIGNLEDMNIPPAGKIGLLTIGTAASFDDILVTHSTGGTLYQNGFGGSPEEGLAAHWSFDNAADSGHDDAGNGNHLDIYGAQWIPDGIDAGAMHFDGDDYMTCSDDPILDMSAGITVAAWIKTDNPSNSYLLAKDDSYVVDFSTSWFEGRIYTGSSWEHVRSSEPYWGEWKHIVFTYNKTAGRLSLHLNGTLVASEPYSGNFVSSSSDLQIGRRLPGDLYFFGLMDEVHIYNHALSRAKILELYNRTPHEIVHGVQGTVTEATTGNPIANATVELGSLSTTTDTGSAYSFGDVSSGTHAIYVSKTGYHSTAKEIDVDSETTVVHDIRLVRDTGSPAIVSVKADYGTEGLYLGGLSLENTYTVEVAWNGTPGTVECILNGTPYTVEGTAMGAEYTFDMGVDFSPSILPLGNTIEITATNQEGETSATVTFHPLVIPIPVWTYCLGDFAPVEDADNPGVLVFELQKQYPDDPFSGEVYLPSWFPYLGGNHFGVKETQAHVRAYIKTDKTAGASAKGSTGFGAAGHEIIGTLGGEGQIKFVPGTGLEWLGARVDLGLGGTISDKIGIVELIPALSGFANVPGVSWLNRKAQVEAEISPAIDFSLYLVDDNGDIAFDSFEGTGSIAAELALVIEVIKSLEAKLYGGGDSTITMQFPKNPNYLKYVMARLYAGIVLKFWIFEYNPEASHIWEYPESASSIMTTTGALSVLTTTEPQIIQPDFLKYGTYSEFVGGPGFSTQDSLGTTGITQREIIRNIYSYSEPALAEYNGTAVLTFVYYDPNDPLLQNTEIHYTVYDGHSFTPPTPIADDTRAEFNPQVAFDGAGQAMAVWERVKDPAFTSDNLEAMAAEMEIVYSIYAPDTDTWTTPAPLTDNDYLDHHPIMKSDSAGNVMLVWESNTQNQPVSDTASPGSINFCLWDGSTWTQTAEALSGVSDALKFDLAYWGTGAILTWTQDEDADLSTLTDQEIYYSEFDGITWSSPLALTNNSVPDSSPQTIMDSFGSIHVIWLQDDRIVHMNGIGNAPQVVRENSEEAGFMDFYLTQNQLGNLVLLWQGQDEIGTDIFYTVYDSDHDSWGKDNRLTRDDAVEKYFQPEFSASGELIMAFNRAETEYIDKTVDVDGEIVTIENVPQPGQNDLYFLSYRISDDLGFIADSLALVESDPVPGTQVTLTATVSNFGDETVEQIPVAFYDGYPENGGTLIGFTPPINRLDAGETAAIQLSWLPPDDASAHTVYAVVDPDDEFLEKNEDNNTLSKEILLPDVAFVTGEAKWQGSFRVSLVAKIKNNGYSDADNVRVTFLKDSEDGEVLGTCIISRLPAGKASDVPLLWPVDWKDFDSEYATVHVDIDPQGAIAESTTTNNSGTISFLVNPPAPYCEGDIDMDGDVDGADLSMMAPDPAEVGPDLFGADFGRIGCPQYQ